jgi:hypothetical protein
MHPQHVRDEALILFEQGVNDCEVARRIGIPRSTVREWRAPSYRSKDKGYTCLRCWHTAKPIMFTPDDYTELLGLYLGDGCISHHGRTDRLRIHLDTKYPEIIREAKALLQRSLPENRVGVVEAEGGAMVYLSLYSSHLVCLFPQHGRGKKHERRILLEAWQRRLVEQAPWGLLRGLIRSDGSVFVNRTGPYHYLAYDFCNKSKDIIDMFTKACRAVGVDYRATCWHDLWRIRINRRRSVDLLLAEVGTKI